MFNSVDDFIYHEKSLLPSAVCKGIIDLFEKELYKEIGEISRGPQGISEVDKKIKDSIDKGYRFSKLKDGCMFQLHSYLDKLMRSYKAKYPFLEGLNPWTLFEHYNVQKYDPNGGYFAVHCEHGPGDTESRRIMAWMVYLNDVHDGGYTAFPTQKKKFQPRVGDALIWPAFWTHPHHGITSKTQTKYIATGWINYMRE